MCRHLAYLGPSIALEALLLAPEHSLERQSWAPKHQTSGVVNADGFGVGWYTDARPEPALYRRTTPIWSDASFRSIAGTISSRAICASVRSATPGFPTDEASTPPFADGIWLFAHNGAVDGFNDGVNIALRRTLSDRRAAQIRSAADSEVLFAMTLDALDEGATPAEALARTVATVSQHAGGRLNLLLTDGARIAATAVGNSLYLKQDEAVVVASEPFDASPGWKPIDDRSIVAADADAVAVDPL